MRKVPLKYLCATRPMEGRAGLRHCLGSGLTVKDIASQLTEKYRTAGDKVKDHLGHMLTIAYDFENSESACKCAKLFGIDLICGLTASESAFIDGCDEEDELSMRRDFSNSIYMYRPITEEFPYKRWPLIVNSDNNSMLTLSANHHIYATMDFTKSLNLIILEDCSLPVLIDEEEFAGSEPLYFTESSHFVSPVYLINLVKKILDYFLAQIGYPHIDIKRKVVFTSSEANLINYSDYLDHEEWQGVDVILQKNVIPNYVIDNASNMFAPDNNPDSIFNQLRSKLLYALCATSKVFDCMSHREMLSDFSPKIMEELAQELDIFY